MNVGIVGAGVARAGRRERPPASAATQVTIFEGRHEVGGQVVTFQVGGEPLECFYHHIFTNDTTVVRYIEELGLGRTLRWIEPKNAHFVKGRIYPFVTPLDLLKFTAIPFTSRVRLGLAAVWLRRQKDWRQVRRRHRARRGWSGPSGKKAFAAFWGPLLKGKFADQADNVGMVWLWSKIYLRFASPEGLGQQGIARLSRRLVPSATTSALADQLRANGGVESAWTRPSRGSTSRTGVVTGIRAGGELHEFDQVLMTTPNIITSRICAGPARRTTRRSSTACATSGRPASSSPSTGRSRPYYWLSIGDDLPFVACIEHTNFIPPERYGGNHVVYLSNYVAPGHPVLEMDADEVSPVYLDGIRALNPEFDPSWVREKWFFKDPGGQPVITTNYSRSIPDMRTGHRRASISRTRPRSTRRTAARTTACSSAKRSRR